jgi:hypothetical protein
MTEGDTPRRRILIVGINYAPEHAGIGNTVQPRWRTGTFQAQNRR